MVHHLPWDSNCACDRRRRLKHLTQGFLQEAASSPEAPASDPAGQRQVAPRERTNVDKMLAAPTIKRQPLALRR